MNYRLISVGAMLAAGTLCAALGPSAPAGADDPTADAPLALAAPVTAIAATPQVTPDDQPPEFPAPDPFADLVDSLVDPLAEATPAAEAGARMPALVPTQPVAEPPPASWTAGPPELGGDGVIAAASALLGIPYVWGGNSLASMDCSAYVSRAWGIPRQTTDTLYQFASAITREDLRPGDVMNLTRAQDPRGYGHVRMFAAWANAQHTRVWVYEETPHQSVYHAIAYDPRYTPMRREHIRSGDAAPLIAEVIDPPRRAEMPAAVSAPARTPAPGTPAEFSAATPRKDPPRADQQPPAIWKPVAIPAYPVVIAPVAPPTTTPAPRPVATPASTPAPPRPDRPVAIPAASRTPAPTPAPPPTPTPPPAPSATPTRAPGWYPAPTATPTAPGANDRRRPGGRG